MGFDDNEAAGEENGTLAIGAAGQNAARLARRLQRTPDGAGPRTSPSLLLQRAPAEKATSDDAIAETAEAGLRGDESDALGRDIPRARPELTLLMPPPKAAGADGPPPSETATESGGGASAGQTGPKAPSAPKQADARAVADRVYELMRQEVVLARLRGAGRGR